MSQWIEQLTNFWLKKIREAQEKKEILFGKSARLLWSFFKKSYADIYIEQANVLETYGLNAISEMPHYKPRINKVFEYVSLYLPFVAARVPTRVVRLRKPPNMDLNEILSTEARAQWNEKEKAAKLLEWWLNYCALETDLDASLKSAVQEALVKGRGVVWTELVTDDNTSGERVMVTSSPDSVDNLFCDPDARTWRDVGYVIRRRVSTLYEAQLRLGLPDEVAERLPGPSALTAVPEDFIIAEANRGTSLVVGDKTRPVVYYEVYSRVGIGHYLAPGDELDKVRGALDQLGRYVMLILAEGIPYPLNLRPDMLNGTTAELSRALEWPIPIYGDPLDPWPCTVLDFIPETDSPWAISPLEPGIPFQVFLDQLYGYIMERSFQSARTIIVTSRELEPMVAEKLTSSQPIEIVSVPQDVLMTLRDAIAPIDLPPVKADIWHVVQFIERAFERAVGLDPLVYGAAQRPAPRSATEVEIRHQFLTSRPNEMADTVERWQSRVAAKEGIASRMFIGPTQIMPVLGETEDTSYDSMAIHLWQKYVVEPDPYKAAAELEFDVVSGSGRRINKQVLTDIAMNIVQHLTPIAMKIAESGNVEPFNKLIKFLSLALDTDLSEFMLMPPQPQPVPPATGEQHVPGTNQPPASGPAPAGPGGLPMPTGGPESGAPGGVPPEMLSILQQLAAGAMQPT